MSSSRMYTWPAWSQQAQHVCFVCMNERQNTADLIYLVFPVFFPTALLACVLWLPVRYLHLCGKTLTATFIQNVLWC